MQAIFKVFIELVTILFLLYAVVSGKEAYGIIAPWPGIEFTSPVMEGKVSTTGLPRKFPPHLFFNEITKILDLSVQSLPLFTHVTG